MIAGQNELAALVLRCSFMLAPTRSETRSRIRNVERNEPQVFFWQGSLNFSPVDLFIHGLGSSINFICPGSHFVVF